MKNPFIKFFKKKPLVLCVHGFGRRRQTEFNNFKLWGKDDYEFVTFDIFDDNDEEDVNPDEWILRCEKQLQSLLKTNRDVYVLGFSMGGVLASYLASKYPVKKLILFAPAFEYISLKSVYNAVLTLMGKTKDPISLSSAHTQAFSQVVDKCKDSIKYVHCPVLFVHGDSDEVIPLRSSLNAYEKVPHENKRLIILHEGPHRLMLNEKTNNEAYQLFCLFMNDSIITYKPELADDPYGLIEKETELQEEKEKENHK